MSQSRRLRSQLQGREGVARPQELESFSRDCGSTPFRKRRGQEIWEGSRLKGEQAELTLVPFSTAQGHGTVEERAFMRRKTEKTGRRGLERGRAGKTKTVLSAGRSKKRPALKTTI
eukprot:6087772-Pleurochrysis_carterae.AAC.2